MQRDANQGVSGFGARVQGVLGLLILATGIAGFLGWPAPFDSGRWWTPLMFCAIGLNWTWAALSSEPRRLRETINLILFVIVTTCWLLAVPWPF